MLGKDGWIDNMTFKRHNRWQLPFPSRSQGQFEVFPHRAVNEKVRGGVDDEEPVVEAGQA
jgi:hypothetical protein